MSATSVDMQVNIVAIFFKVKEGKNLKRIKNNLKSRLSR